MIVYQSIAHSHASQEPDQHKKMQQLHVDCLCSYVFGYKLKIKQSHIEACRFNKDKTMSLGLATIRLFFGIPNKLHYYFYFYYLSKTKCYYYFVQHSCMHVLLLPLTFSFDFEILNLITCYNKNIVTKLYSM
jgi:hypothetical protein